MKNIIIYYGRKKKRFFLFYHEIIFYSAELFDVAVNFYLNIFDYVLNKNTNQNIKGAICQLRSSYLFWNQPYREVLEVKCQTCHFTGILSFAGVLEDFGYIFPTCFLQNFSQLNS